MKLVLQINRPISFRYGESFRQIAHSFGTIIYFYMYILINIQYLAIHDKSRLECAKHNYREIMQLLHFTSSNC